MILLTAGALTVPQLPARVSNVYTTDARLDGIGLVASTPQTKILATPVRYVHHAHMVGGHRCRNQHRWCDDVGMGEIIVILSIRADVPYYGHILVVEMLRRREW